MADDMEVQILLSIRADLDKLVKTKKELTGLTSEVEQGGKKRVAFLKEEQLQLRGLISPIVMLRRTWFQLGILWALTAGTVIGSIEDIKKKQLELNDMSTKTGESVEVLSKKMYGFNIATEEAKNGVYALQEIQQNLNRAWTVATFKVTEVVGNIKTAVAVEKEFNKEAQKQASQQAKGQSFWDFFKTHGLAGGVLMREAPQVYLDPIKVKKTAEDAEKIVRDFEKKKRWEFNETQGVAILLQGELRSKIKQFKNDEIGATKEANNAVRKIYEDTYGPDSKTVSLFNEFANLQESRIKLSIWGLRDTFQMMQDMQKQFGQSTTKLFGDVFIDALDNKLKGSRQIFSAFIMDLRNILIRAEMEKLVGSMAVSGGFNWAKSAIGGLLGAGGSAGAGSSISGGIGGTTTNTAQFGTTWSPYHTGGIVRAHSGLAVDEVPIIAQTGERVLSRKQNEEYERGSDTNNVYYYINAIDAASFSELVARNPEAIVAVTDKAIKQNKGIRRTIKGYT